MIDAERQLLAHALKDPDNQHFVLLSESCVPLHNFDYVYNYLMHANMSFVDCFEDPGPHGNGKYLEHMLSEVEKKKRKVAVKRERSEAQQMKKAMKELYQSEAQQAQKVAAIASPSSIRLM